MDNTTDRTDMEEDPHVPTVSEACYLYGRALDLELLRTRHISPDEFRRRQRDREYNFQISETAFGLM